ncbi:16157_t:CDS:2 [Funneliformis geosporum]|uniref:10557_t:CDS:1 n=1 Tax=Funneliformis geosporum TaxID=1117311 RepID=A0A9W4WX35_9GLOM|nr:16157_t:CDS:2 [Funneliformis geosporum]CAI2178708.1 10557_t:CDS:2 [Funneliformis geosporum]
MGSFRRLSTCIGAFLLLGVSLTSAQSADNNANSYSMIIIAYLTVCKLTNISNAPGIAIDGSLRLWPDLNQNVQNLYEDNEWIAFIKCDDNPNTNLQNVLIAEENNASASVFYTVTSKPCQNLTSDRIKKPLFTTTEQSCSEVINQFRPQKDEITAVIKPDGNSNNINPSAPISVNGSEDNRVIATYQTAMIVLYAVSGVVLGLFFIVVITNIIRNRLNAPAAPPSQGQDTNARPRRGIARSVLDSFPVFLFTMGMKDYNDENKDLEGGKGKELEADIELETTSPDVMKSAPQAEEIEENENSSNLYSKNTNENFVTNNDINSEKNKPDLPQVPPIAQINNSSHIRSISTGSILSALTNNKVQDGQLTCPICLDDFESGVELRILPCHHQICIDPWLLDISPLCPMCKTDYTSWESEVNTTQQSEDELDSSTSLESTDHATTTNNDRQNDDGSSIAPSVPPNFPHFRWIKYLTSIRSRRRRNRDRRSNRQSRTESL